MLSVTHQKQQLMHVPVSGRGRLCLSKPGVQACGWRNRFLINHFLVKTGGQSSCAWSFQERTSVILREVSACFHDFMLSGDADYSFKAQNWWKAGTPAPRLPSPSQGAPSILACNCLSGISTNDFIYPKILYCFPFRTKKKTHQSYFLIGVGDTNTPIQPHWLMRLVDSERIVPLFAIDNQSLSPLYKPYYMGEHRPNNDGYVGNLGSLASPQL